MRAHLCVLGNALILAKVIQLDRLLRRYGPEADSLT